MTMKSLRIFSFVAMGFGTLLFLVGAIFKIQHWPDMFYGIISGPIIILIGIVTLFISLIKRKEDNKNTL